MDIGYSSETPSTADEEEPTEEKRPCTGMTHAYVTSAPTATLAVPLTASIADLDLMRSLLPRKKQVNPLMMLFTVAEDCPSDNLEFGHLTRLM